MTPEAMLQGLSSSAASHKAFASRFTVLAQEFERLGRSEQAEECWTNARKYEAALNRCELRMDELLARHAQEKRFA